MKDKALQREQTRVRVERYRNKQNSVTSDSVTVGVLQEWYPNKRTDDKGGAITPVTLSDGQKWYPRPSEGETMGLPNHIARDIITGTERYSHIKGQPSLKDRVSKALEYQGLS